MCVCGGGGGGCPYERGTIKSVTSRILVDSHGEIAVGAHGFSIYALKMSISVT